MFIIISHGYDGYVWFFFMKRHAKAFMINENSVEMIPEITFPRNRFYKNIKTEQIQIQQIQLL